MTSALKTRDADCPSFSSSWTPLNSRRKSLALKNRPGRRLLDNWPAKVIALAVAVVVVLLNDLTGVEERYFSVPLDLVLADNLVPGEAFTDRVRVTLRGDEGQIFRVLEDDIVATADFSGHSVDGVFRAPVSVDRRGTALDADVLEISVEPLTITVTLEEKLVKSVGVVPNLVGFPPPGYELTDYRVSPTQVALAGPRSQLADFSTVVTEEIDLTGRTGDFTEAVRLESPGDLVDFPGGSVVDFRALITETVVQSEFRGVEITIVDLDPALRVVSEIPLGTIRVQGKQLDLEGIPESRVSIVVDAGSVAGAGTFELPTRPQIPSGILVLGIEPARVELTVEERLGQDSPSPGIGDQG
jgi:YbbR domain-containing protein